MITLETSFAGILGRSVRLRCLTTLLVLAGIIPMLHGQALSTPPMANGQQTPLVYNQLPTGANGGDQSQMSSQASQTGIQNPPGALQTLTVLYPDPNQYVLNIGDLINVRVYAVNDYFSTVRISKDGTVQLPLIGPLNLAGVTIRQAQDMIATALKTSGMFRNPEIILGIAESSRPPTITFAGEKTGIYPLLGQRSLLDVIAASGGLPNTASRTISIIRPGIEAPITVNLGNTPQEMIKANIPVQTQDTIFVERSGVVYMLGAFKQQGAYPLPVTGMTLMQAAALAQGAQYAGKYNDLRLVRTNGSERTEVKVDIKRIQFGQDPDPLLQAGDILFLPTTPLKRALAANGLGTLLAAVSILLIAIYPR